MKRLLFILIVGSLAGSCAFAREQSILARVTVYWPSGEGPQRAFFNGAKLHGGHCAVDPKKIPFGSEVIFPDAACVAVDTGPAVVRRTAARKSGKTADQRNALVIDRFFETRKQALAWAAAHPHFMNVRVLDPRSKRSEVAQVGRDVSPNVSTRTSERDGSAPIQPRPNSAGSALPDIRGSLVPAFFGAALPRS